LFYIHIKPTVTSRIWCPVKTIFQKLEAQVSLYRSPDINKSS
jgi:hypothetical protein